MTEQQVLLSVKNLSTQFFSQEGVLDAVDGVSFDIRHGEALGIAGESGCGKSVTAQSILRIVPKNGRIVAGEILWQPNGLASNGEVVDLIKLDDRGQEIRRIRGAEIAMVFQEPMSAFSMVYTIGNQITEVIRLHQRCTEREARERAIEILRRVGMPRPEQTIDAYPFALSGGMCQRAMIAMALSCNPGLLIADEPTTAVDVTIQAQVLELMKDLQREMGMALIVITHDLAVISELCDRVMIMYLGKDVESAPRQRSFAIPNIPIQWGCCALSQNWGKGIHRRLPQLAAPCLIPISARLAVLFTLVAQSLCRASVMLIIRHRSR